MTHNTFHNTKYVSFYRNVGKNPIRPMHKSNKYVYRNKKTSYECPWDNFQYRVQYIKTQQTGVKVRPSTRCLGLQRKARCKEPVMCIHEQISYQSINENLQLKRTKMLGIRLRDSKPTKTCNTFLFC